MNRRKQAQLDVIRAKRALLAEAAAWEKRSMSPLVDAAASAITSHPLASLAGAAAVGAMAAQRPRVRKTLLAGVRTAVRTATQMLLGGKRTAGESKGDRPTLHISTGGPSGNGSQKGFRLQLDPIRISAIDDEE